MLPVLIGLAISALVPFFCCLVPPLARFTFFPLVTRLVYHFASQYIHSCFYLRYWIGSFPIRSQSALIKSESEHPSTLRGFSISLHCIKLRKAFLQALALDKKGIGPIRVDALEISIITVHIASTWHVVVEVEGVKGSASLLQPTTANAIEMDDVIAMKISEIRSLSEQLQQATRRVLEDSLRHKSRSAKVQESENQDQKISQNQTESSRKFPLKDRVLQMIMGQIEIRVKDVNMAVSSKSCENEGTVSTKLEPSSTAELSALLGAAAKLTLGVSLQSMTVVSSIQSGREAHALDDLLTSSTAKVSYQTSFSGISVYERVGQSEEQKRTEFVSIPDIVATARVPPIPRLLGLVNPEIAPIVYEDRDCNVELLFAGVHKLELKTQLLVDLLHAFGVPFMNHAALIETLRRLEAEKTATFPLSAPDKDTYRKLLTDSQGKENAETLSTIESFESRMTTEDILKFRNETYNWSDILSDKATDTFQSITDFQALLSAHFAKKDYAKISKMEVAVRVENMSFDFGRDAADDLAQLVLSQSGINCGFTAHPEDENALFLDAELIMHQLKLSSKSRSVASFDQVVYTDSKQLADAISPPQALKSSVQLFHSGLQSVNFNLSDCIVVLNAEALELLLLFLTDLSCKIDHALSSTRPVANVPETEDSIAQEIKTLATSTELPHLAPFTILGGRKLQFNASISESHIIVLPASTFPIKTPSDDKSSNYENQSCLNLPFSIIISVTSQADAEQLDIDITRFGIYANKPQTASDEERNVNDSILSPGGYGFRYCLEKSAEDPYLCLANLYVMSPDIIFMFSDYSAAVAASCAKAFQSIDTTRQEQVELRAEGEARQGKIRHFAEVDAAIERMQRFYQELKTENEGRMSLPELVNLVKHARIGEELLESELMYFLRALFRDLDQRNDGTISFESLTSFIRAEILEQSNARTEMEGKSQLYGALNLRAGEYTSDEQLEKLLGHNFDSIEALQTTLSTDPLQTAFFKLYESETRASRTSLESQSFLILQKKLVRLLRNYKAAELFYSRLIIPSLQASEGFEWALKPHMHCGGISDYENAASLIAKRKRKGIYSATLTEVEEVQVEKQVRIASSDNESLKKVRLSTSFELGSIELFLTDMEIPTQFSRGNLYIQDIQCSVALFARNIVPIQRLNIAKIFTTETTDWTFLFGAKLSSSFYNDLTHTADYSLEPWQIMAGLSSVEGECGISVLMEAQQRFQINVTPALLKVCQSLAELTDDTLQERSLSAHHESLDVPDARSRTGKEILLQNQCGYPLKLRFRSDMNEIALNVDERLYTREDVPFGNEDSLESLEIVGWGKITERVSLPAFGVVNVGIQEANAKEEACTVFMTLSCRLDDPLRRCIAFQSNILLSNHTSEKYNIQHLAIGNSKTQIELSSGSNSLLPLSAFMGITELYGRPDHFQDFIVKATMNNDVLTSKAVVEEIRSHQEKRSKISHKKGKAIVYQDTEDTSAVVVKQLSPTVVLRRWHYRTHFEWEVCILPAFVLRNSLPYRMEYRFIEYTSRDRKKSSAELLKDVELQLHAEQSTELVGGIVESGHDAEISKVSCMLPGYLCVRLLTETAVSPWSRALLMAIHGSVDLFTTKKEEITLATGLVFNLDRLTVPNFPRLVRFSSPFWIVNNTSFDLCFASSPRTAPLPLPKAFTCPIMADLPDGRLCILPKSVKSERPKAWATIEDIPDSVFSSSSINDEIQSSASYCDPINITTVNTEGECACGPNAFAVKVEGLYGVFENSIALKFGPRYFCQNRLGEMIYLQAFSTTENSSEKARDAFCKRTTEQVNRVKVHFRDGETAPLYHFASLRKGEALSKSQKYISLSFSNKWDSGSAYSYAIPINAASDLYLQLYSLKRKRPIICLASIQIVEMYVYIILSDVCTAPPYRIENFTPFAMEFCQLGSTGSLFASTERESKQLLKSGRWCAFAWHNPVSSERHVEVRLSSRDHKTPPQKYDLDYVGYQAPLKLEIGTNKGSVSVIEISVQVLVAENTRVLKLIEKQVEVEQYESQEAELLLDFQKRKVLYASVFDIRFFGIGISLFDALPQEVLFFSVDHLQISKSGSSLAWNCSITHCQIDNMLSAARFPVILNPLDSGYSTKGNNNLLPLFQITLEANMSARIGIFKLLDVQLRSITVKIDLDYLFSLVKLIDPFFSSDKIVAATSKRMRNKILEREVPSIAEFSADESIRKNTVYFDLLRIHSFSIDSEYILTRKEIVSTTQGGNHSVIFGLLSQVVGLVGSNLGGSPYFRFNQIVIARCFSTKERLKTQLIQNFIRQAVIQAYRLIGSADIIGNPIGLVENLGSGVFEFLKITKDEVTGDAQTRGEGVRVLGKTLAKSGVGTFAKITGSLDRFVGEFAEEDEASDTNLSMTDASKEGTGNSVLDGGLKFAKDFGKGVTGILTKPVEGAKKGGVTGLMQGAVQGIAGPGVVLLKQLTSTSHSIALNVQSTVVDRSPFNGRRRYPKEEIRKEILDEMDRKNDEKPKELVLEVISANKLVSGKSTDASCAVELDNKTILKTRTLYHTADPSWNEKVAVELKGKEKSIKLIVRDLYGGAIERVIGQTVLHIHQLRDDFRPPACSSDLARWVKTGVKPGDKSKNESHEIKQKAYPLWKPPEASSKARMAQLFQIALNVVRVRDLKLKNSSVLGSLVGKKENHRENLSAYVVVNVGHASSKTDAMKIEYSQGEEAEGSAEWNQHFTFIYDPSARDKDLLAVFQLKEKSVFHDDTLATASSRLPSKAGSSKRQTMTLPLTYSDTDQVSGSLEIQMEIVHAPESQSQDKKPLEGVMIGTISIACDFR